MPREERRQDFWGQKIGGEISSIEQAQRYFQGKRQSFVLFFVGTLLFGPILNLLTRNLSIDIPELGILGYTFVAVWLFYVVLYAADFLEKVRELGETLPKSKKRLARFRESLIADIEEMPRHTQKTALLVLSVSLVILLLEVIFLPADIKIGIASLFTLLFALFLLGLRPLRTDTDRFVDSLLELPKHKLAVRVVFIVLLTLFLILILMSVYVVVISLLSITYYGFLPSLVTFIVSESFALYFLDKLGRTITKQWQNSRVIEKFEMLEKDVRYGRITKDESIRKEFNSIKDMKSYAW